MRHARAGNRLSRTSEHRKALLSNMAGSVLEYGRIRTTLAKAKESRRVVDHLISLGKEGSVHSRRQAFRILKDRQLVKQLFADIAPRFLDCQGGYTRILKLSERPGDNAMVAFLELTRVPVEPAKGAKKAAAKETPAPQSPAAPAKQPSGEEPEKPKGFFEGLKKLLRPKEKAGARSS